MSTIQNEQAEDIEAAVAARVQAERESLAAAAYEKIPADDSPYFEQGGYLCRKKPTKDGEMTIKLCNFTAKIAGETVIDDGLEAARNFRIVGKLRGVVPLPEIEIPAATFSGMNWLSKWGARCILSPGQTVKDCCRHAFQIESGNVKTETFYGHTGWRKIDGEWCFLHAAGAIGGPDGVAVRLPRELERYNLPPLPLNNPAGEQVTRRGMRASLDFLDIGRRSVTLPLWAGVYLAPLVSWLSPSPNFVLFLQGISGTYKSTVAVLAAAHFGAFSGVSGLSNFSDTAGVLEKRAFTLKDVLTVIDDWHPAGNRRGAEAMAETAQRMIRSFSNRTGRARLNSDMSERQRYSPRGLALFTAEELPTLESTLARLCVISVDVEDIDREKLTALQAEAEFLPYSMTAYLLFLKKNYTTIVKTFPGRFHELRRAAAEAGFHRKLPEQVAFSVYAVELAAAFFLEKGMLDADAARRLCSDAWETFRFLSQRQDQRIKEDDPVDRFFDVIQTQLIQHAARLDPLPTHDGLPLGAGVSRIGYFDNSAVYLLPVAAWHAVQAFSQKESAHFPLGRNAFLGMLRSKGIIMASPRGDHHTFLKIDGKTIRVLKIIDKGVYRKIVESVSE